MIDTLHRFILVPMLLFGLCIMGGCELVNVTGEVDYGRLTEVAYTPHIQPLLDRKCGACHAGADPAAGLRTTGWDALIAGSDYGEALIPFDAARSLMVELMTQRVGDPHPLEQGADTLTQDELGALIRWIDGGARHGDGTVPYADAEHLLFVCNQNAALISVIDTQANVVIRTIDLQALGFSDKAKPHHTAREASGAFWYVSLIGENKVLKFDRDHRLVGSVDFEAPGMLALDPNSDRLFVGRSMSAVNPPSRVGVIDRIAMTLEEIDVLFPRPHALILSPDGGYLYTASLAQNRIISVNTTTQEVDFSALDQAETQVFVQFAISPDGGRLYVTSQRTAQVHVLDVSNPPMAVYVATIPTGHAPWHPVLSADGGTLYVGNKMSNSVSVIDTATLTPIATLTHEGLSQPHGSARSNDGRYLYISSNNESGDYTPRHDLGDNANVGTVVIIDTATHTVVKVLEVEAWASGLSPAL